jgi:hypothetical protein
MSVEFQPLPPEHELAAAGSALVALKGQKGRLIVHTHIFTRGSDVRDDTLADAYVTFLGHHELGMAWPAVPVAELCHALSVLVWKEQAYDCEVVDETTARDAVTRWLAAFPRPLRAYTNGDVLLDHASPRPTGGGYNPVIGATFDTGAIVIGGDIIGMLWAADED